MARPERHFARNVGKRHGDNQSTSVYSFHIGEYIYMCIYILVFPDDNRLRRFGHGGRGAWSECQTGPRKRVIRVNTDTDESLGCAGVPPVLPGGNKAGTWPSRARRRMLPQRNSNMLFANFNQDFS